MTTAAPVQRAFCRIAGVRAHEIPRIPILSLTRDLAAVTFGHLVGRLHKPELRPLLVDEGADYVTVRHPFGRMVEIMVVAGACAGGSLISRWIGGAVFDEKPYRTECMGDFCELASSAIPSAWVDAAFRELPRSVPTSGAIGIIDSSAGRGDAFVWAIGQWGITQPEEEYEGDFVTENGATFQVLTLNAHGQRVLRGTLRAMDRSLCFLCGELGANTTEHILPRSMYVPPLPDDVLTAPTHQACNASVARDEEWLVHLWSLTPQASDVDRARWEKSVRALKRERATLMRTAFLESFSDHPSGRVAVHVEHQRIANVLAKIARGILFKADGLLVSQHHSWAFRRIDLELMEEQPFERQVEVHDVAIFRWQVLPGSIGPTVFWAIALFNMHIYWGAAVSPLDIDELATRIPILKDGVPIPWPRPAAHSQRLGAVATP